MLILLPPSESKASRDRGTPWRPGTQSFAALDDARVQVADALAAVSATPEAPAVLGVSPRLGDEIARNLALRSAPALPVAELYTGVLYDALDLASLDASARRRARRDVVVQSALHGALRLGDRVAPYRLSMSVSLPPLGPLAAWWRPRLDPVMTAAAGSGVVLDCRSSTYAAAWSPSGEVAERWVHVAVPGVSHHAKHTRGLVARAVCAMPTTPRSVRALAQGLAAAGFDVELRAPARPGRPWLLEVSPGLSTPG